MTQAHPHRRYREAQQAEVTWGPVNVGTHARSPPSTPEDAGASWPPSPGPHQAITRRSDGHSAGRPVQGRARFARYEATRMTKGKRRAQAAPAGLAGPESLGWRVSRTELRADPLKRLGSSPRWARGLVDGPRGPGKWDRAYSGARALCVGPPGHTGMGRAGNRLHSIPRPHLL